ncbi:TFIIE alpha subunit domain-containing protein [Sarocladium implicatum]|nr:TFIIE alpha subunit domain-containing protein [Sarocladium implicatum]
MDLAITLVKSVIRAFYSTREILVIDALILHQTYVVLVLRDDDLAYLMSINTKDLHKICGKLREDRLLTVYAHESVAELKEGNPRPSNRTWYYINYRNTIDAIKWRVYQIDKDVQGVTVPADERKEYFCNRCGAEWTAMEVLDNSGPDGFLCHKCDGLLHYEADRNAGGHEQSTRLNSQFKFISELLPKIDSVHIPECDFDRAFNVARPVVRDATHQREQTIAADGGANRPMAVKGLTNSGPQSIAVNISTSDGPSEAEKEAERTHKEQIAKQNALPSWMSNSTVTGESFSAAADNTVTSAPGASLDDSKTKNGAVTVDSNTTAEIDAIFEKLKADQLAKDLAERKEDMEEEESGSSEDEEELDFEDVKGIESGSEQRATATPSIKREKSEALSQEDDSDCRHAKRVKVEPEVKKEESDEDDDDDDELEFEDV